MSGRPGAARPPGPTRGRSCSSVLAGEERGRDNEDPIEHTHKAAVWVCVSFGGFVI